MQSSTGRKLMEMFDLMLTHFGPQHWWPGETEFEMMVGAILTQNTSWNNVEKAIENLKKDNLLSIKALHAASPLYLAQNIRPAGYFNIKTGRIKNLINFLMENYNGEIAGFLSEETGELKEKLISVKGVGPETADSILLYAAKRPVFVIDTYTHRILNRHGMEDDQNSYYDLQEFFMDNLPEDTMLFNEFHALIVKTGKEYCRRKRLCDICPLEKWKT
ncbi:endonuclease III domain-containing protein [Thermodesulfobacteriota bacterium]